MPHQRSSMRLTGYDYRLAGGYFITICTRKRKCTLGSIASGVMSLSHAGSIVESTWMGIQERMPGIELDAFVVMPNHVHGILF